MARVRICFASCMAPATDARPSGTHRCGRIPIRLRFLQFWGRGRTTRMVIVLTFTDKPVNVNKDLARRGYYFRWVSTTISPH